MLPTGTVTFLFTDIEAQCIFGKTSRSDEERVMTMEQAIQLALNTQE